MLFGIALLGAVAILLVMVGAVLATCDDDPVTKEFRERLGGKGAGKMFALSTLALVGLYLIVSRFYKQIVPIIMKLYFCYVLTTMSIVFLRPRLFRRLYPNRQNQEQEQEQHQHLEHLIPCFKLYSIDFVSIAAAVPLLILYWFSDNWLLMDALAVCVALFTVDIMRFKSLTVASLTMAAFFVYDVYFVFFTPIMVTVAKQLTIPAKLVWPRQLEAFSIWIPYSDTSKFTMLGLGDIILPGVYITLLVRIEKAISASKQAAGTKAEHPPKKVGLARACIFAYFIAICMALFVLYTFEKAQPVLLYIVPCLLVTTYGVLYCKCDKDLRSKILAYVDEEDNIVPFKPKSARGNREVKEDSATDADGHSTEQPTNAEEDQTE